MASLKHLSLFVLLCTPLCQCASRPSRVPAATLGEDLGENRVREMERLRSKIKNVSPTAINALGTDLFFKANDASLRGDSEMASFLFAQVMQLFPEDLYIKKRYAIELFRLGNIKEAKPLFGELFKEKNKEDEALGLILGTLQTQLGELKQAEKTYLQFLKAHPKNEDGCVLLAKLYGGLEQYKKAEGILNRCLSFDRKGVFYYYKGKVAFAQKRKTEAMKNFSLALKIDPDHTNAALAKGFMFEMRQQFKAALKVYKKFLKSNPEDFRVLSRLIQVKLAIESFGGIEHYLERLVALAPHDINLKIRLGIFYFEKKNYDKAQEVFMEISTAFPKDDRGPYYLASIYQKTNRHEKAIEFFSKIPGDSRLLYEVAVQMALSFNKLISSSKEKEPSIEKFVQWIQTKIKKRKELKLELSFVLATFYESLNHFKRAIKVLASTRDIEGYSEDHEYYLASLYEKVKNYKKARDIIIKILEKNPQNSHALNFLGYSFLIQGDDMKKAYNLIDKAIKLSPDDGHIRDSLGWYYYKMGNYNRALKEILKASKLVKNDPVIIKHLGMVYQKLNRRSKAKKYFMEALKHCRGEVERKEIQKLLKELGPLSHLSLELFIPQ